MQAVEDGGAGGGILDSLLGVEAHDVAARLAPRPPIANHDLLDFDCRFPTARPRYDKRHHRLAVGQHDLAYLGVTAFTRPEDVVDAAPFELSDRLGADHAPIGDHAHPPDAEAFAQARDDRQQGFHIGGVARPGLGADRPSLGIDHHADDHLLELGPMVLRLAMPTEALAASAAEHQRGVSRPKESHLRPLAEPDVNLSAHPAPITQPTTDIPSANKSGPWECHK